MKKARIYLTEFAVLNGMKLGKRMAPGYSYKIKKTNSRIIWNLNEQTKLFKMFKDFEISVKLLESSAMIPRMSRSGIFGIKS